VFRQTLIAAQIFKNLLVYIEPANLHSLEARYWNIPLPSYFILFLPNVSAFQIYFIIVSPTPRSPSYPVFRFSDLGRYCIHFPSLPCVLHVCVVLLHFATVILFNAKNKIRNCSLCSSLHPFVTSFELIARYMR
jgi:hypothetical protein